jgi:hypothetical protein
LKFFLGQPGKSNVLALLIFSAFARQNFKDLGRGAVGGLSLRRNLKKTPTDRYGDRFFKELNCY